MEQPHQCQRQHHDEHRLRPRIAVDQASGNVAVSWYDCRDDTNNVRTRVYAAVSTDGGQTFSPSFPLEPGSSSAAGVPLPRPYDYFDYTGLAYFGGYFYAAWADNSNSTGDNPDGTSEMDIYVAKVPY